MTQYHSTEEARLKALEEGLSAVRKATTSSLNASLETHQAVVGLRTEMRDSFSELRAQVAGKSQVSKPATPYWTYVVGVLIALDLVSRVLS